MRRARIGITTGFQDQQQRVDVRYIRAVEAAGGIPIIVPLLQDETTARDIASLLDGLIITGGPGITRGLIGDLPSDLPAVDTQRDRSDKLIYEAMSNRPLLRICYGMQFVNAMAGGTIFGDVQVQADADCHSAERGGSEHEIRVMPATYLESILPADKLLTNSHHIQAIARPGTSLRVSARASDGTIEAIESDDGRVIGVQFHPERMMEAGSTLFVDLIRRAAASPSPV